MSGTRKQAITLAETLITLAIIGVLAILSLSITQFSNKDEKVLIGKKKQAESLIVSVSKALASNDTTGLALTALTQSDESLRDGFAPKLNTKNAQAVVNDFSGYNTPEKFIKPASLPAVELTNGTKVAFQKLNTSCATASDGGAPCALAYVDVSEKAAGGETPQFLMAIYRDRAVSEYELCEGYEGGKTTDVECPANLPNGNKKKIEICELGVITTTYEGICCPSDQIPNGEECVCKNSDMELVGETCVCKNNTENIDGACVCTGKTEPCPSNTKKIGKIIYDGICSAEGKSFELKENACKCPASLPNEASTGICYAACSGGKIFVNDVCKCPDNLPNEINGVCTCSNIVESCTSPKVGNITYAAACSASGKVKGDKIAETCTCPSKENITLGNYTVYNPTNEYCSVCIDPVMKRQPDGSCTCPPELPFFDYKYEQKCVLGPMTDCEDYGKDDVNLIFISSAEDLAKIGIDKNYPLNGSYCQIREIDMEYEKYANWTPVGTFSKPFTGKYDGNNQKVINLVVAQNKSYAGLFGVSSGKIHRLGVQGSVSGKSYVGGIVGYMKGGILQNNYFSGSVAATSSYSGALSGRVTKGTISNSYAIADVSGKGYSGGLVGDNLASMKSVFFTGNVTNKGSYTGGLVGVNRTTLSDAYAIGSVTGASYVGGAVGQQNASAVSHVYVANKVTAGSTKGGFIGIVSGTTKFDGCYVNASVNAGSEYECVPNELFSPLIPNCGSGKCDEVVAKNTAQLQVSKGIKNIYANWADNVWCFNCSNYPILKEMPEGAPDWFTCGIKCSCPDGATGVYDDCECPEEVPNYDVDCNVCTSCPLYGTLYVYRLVDTARNRSLKNLIKLSDNQDLFKKVTPDRFFRTNKSNAEYYDPYIVPTQKIGIYIVTRFGDVIAEIPYSHAAALVSSNCISTCKSDAACKESCQKYVGLNTLGNISGSNGSMGTGTIYIDGCKYSTSGGYFRSASPLVLDLKGDGFTFSSPEDGIQFDLSGDGVLEQIGWTRIQDEFDNAFLCVDKNNNGQIDNGKELFGDQSGESTGFEELAKYDSNGDGVVNKKDNGYKDLLLWVDFNKNGKVDYYRIVKKKKQFGGGEYEVQEECDPTKPNNNQNQHASKCKTDEFRTLEDMNVTELATKYEMNYDDDGNVKTDKHGNVTGIVGQFKMMVEEWIDGVKQFIEKIFSMIDVFFVSLRG